MERPGLQKLLEDVEVGLIDVVIVYKIDRLTRSLSDFSRIVEIFEKAEASFVSVTQSFNTTDSMGRLMLNVLLSFVQFECEVTGERIRDKIAASKAKGMWMGGSLPLGYDRPLQMTNKLLVNEEEAQTVRHIFKCYLELGSVHTLQREMAEQGIISKRHVTKSGKTLGGSEISRGALFYLLRNQTYLGKIVHKEDIHEGEHDAIVDEDLFAKVQVQLDGHARRRGKAEQRRTVKAALTGKLFDAHGEAMSPTFSRGRGGKIYRYYVSASLQKGERRTDEDIVQRVPAPAMEKLVNDYVKHWLGSDDTDLSMVRRVRLTDQGLQIKLTGNHRKSLPTRLGPSEAIVRATSKSTSIAVKVALPIKGGHRIIAPENQRYILAGKQLPMLNLEKLMRMSIPI
ncbi:recombinase family protein [Parasphingorhabdus sp. DH2-15]|uniref:recombinase family protein n=1 Tax=Parasphingorhabdus sp. DH2-15 TaxID=3444112 RepID=UPI003F687884